MIFTGCRKNNPVLENSVESGEKRDEPIVSIIDEPNKEEKSADAEKEKELAEEVLESTFHQGALSKRNYEVIDGEAANFLSYNYQDRSMYIAGLKVFEEFSTLNEGGISIVSDENILTFGITKATGSVTGAVDGPNVYFEMNLTSNEIIDSKFEPAPNYAELGKTEFIKHSEEVIELTDERMVEIGLYFKELIMEIEKK